MDSTSHNWLNWGNIRKNMTCVAGRIQKVTLTQNMTDLTKEKNSRKTRLICRWSHLKGHIRLKGEWYYLRSHKWSNECHIRTKKLVSGRYNPKGHIKTKQDWSDGGYPGQIHDWYGGSHIQKVTSRRSHPKSHIRTRVKWYEEGQTCNTTDVTKVTSWQNILVSRRPHPKGHINTKYNWSDEGHTRRKSPRI